MQRYAVFFERPNIFAKKMPRHSKKVRFSLFFALCARFCMASCFFFHDFVPHCSWLCASLFMAMCFIVHGYVLHCSWLCASLFMAMYFIVHGYVLHCSWLCATLCVFLCCRVPASAALVMMLCVYGRTGRWRPARCAPAYSGERKQRCSPPLDRGQIPFFLRLRSSLCPFFLPFSLFGLSLQDV